MFGVNDLYLASGGRDWTPLDKYPGSFGRPLGKTLGAKFTYPVAAEVGRHLISTRGAPVDHFARTWTANLHVSERLREAQTSSYNRSFKTERFCYQTSKQLLHFVVRSVPVHFGGLPSSSDVRLLHSFSSIWIDKRRARAHLSVSETRLDRQASSEITF